MARFRVFQDTTAEVNSSDGVRSVSFLAGEVIPKDEVEGDFLVRVLVPGGFAEKIDTAKPVKKESK